MRLKVLILPFFIVMSLILLIGYIKPDYDLVQQKKIDIQTQADMVAKVDTVVSNVDSLNSSLDTQQDFEKFLYRYLPNTLNQEQVVDAVNFFATQSGVVITDMGFKIPPAQVEVAADDSGLAPDGSPVTPRNTMKTFIFSGGVIGSYENVKAFFDFLAHMERSQKVRSFLIGSDGVADALDTSHLKGTYEAEFGYLPQVPTASALNMAVFQRPKIDFSNVSKLLERTTSTVPVLVKGQTGRPNPFQ